MYKVTRNPQANYSLTALADALFRLMETASFQEITVTDICKEAQITRRTFYRNCSDKMDLVDYLIVVKLRTHLTTADLGSEDLNWQYRNFFAYWKGEAVFLRTLWKERLFDHFHRLMTECCIKDLDYKFLNDFLSGKENADKLRLFHNAFTIGGLCNILAFWTAEEFETSIDDIVSVVRGLSPAAFWS